MKVLIVDDSAVMRRIMTQAISQGGTTDIAEAADGEEAVSAASKEDFGLVLMDWNMPKMLGIDALKAIRAMGKQMPIIMVTTEAEKSRVLEALKAGANNYIIKPFKPAVILQKIEETMEKLKS